MFNDTFMVWTHLREEWMPTPDSIKEFREKIRGWLDCPLSGTFYDGLGQSEAETFNSKVLTHFFHVYLPDDCKHVTHRDVLTITLARLQERADWAEAVEANAESVRLAQRLFGEDPADIAADCDEDVLKCKNFRAFSSSLQALGGGEKLALAALERHLKNLRAGPDLVRHAISAFTFDKPRAEWEIDQKVMAEALTSLGRWVSQTVASCLDVRGKSPS